MPVYFLFTWSCKHLSAIWFCFSANKIGAGAIIAAGSIMKGDVTIGPGTVVETGARILAEAGPIIIGGGNIIQSNALIVNRYY